MALKLSTTELPELGGEDFSYFSRVVPGGYFYLGNGRRKDGQFGLHTEGFNFNDKLIEIASLFWINIVEIEF